MENTQAQKLVSSVDALIENIANNSLLRLKQDEDTKGSVKSVSVNETNFNEEAIKTMSNLGIDVTRCIVKSIGCEIAKAILKEAIKKICDLGKCHHSWIALENKSQTLHVTFDKDCKELDGIPIRYRNIKHNGKDVGYVSDLIARNIKVASNIIGHTDFGKKGNIAIMNMHVASLLKNNPNFKQLEEKVSSEEEMILGVHYFGTLYDIDIYINDISENKYDITVMNISDDSENEKHDFFVRYRKCTDAEYVRKDFTYSLYSEIVKGELAFQRFITFNIDITKI